MDVLKLLFAPMMPLVNHPERLAAIAVVCFLAAALAFLVKRHGGWPLVGLGVVWTLLAWWEHYCKEMGYNIRVDLFLIAPCILPLGIGSGYAIWKAFWKQLPAQFSLWALLMAMTLVAVALAVVGWLMA
jgi:hypothetical protein